MKTPREMLTDVRSLLALPRLTVDLMHGETAGNDPFYSRTVREFYRAARKRHRKFPLIRAMEYGVAVCVLPRSFDDYLMAIEASARRNFKKAQRLGYGFRRIAYNDFLPDISAVLRSTDIRQGKVPEQLRRPDMKRCEDPPSRTDIHDYAYFGVLREGHLYAYAGCLVSGEIAMIEQLYGHVARQPDGIVPMLIMEIARHILDCYPRVKYYAYGTYFGAGTTLRRFKTKFAFRPHRIEWTLG